ncbi:MAG: phosphohistidine phosphatase SixA [bacterium]
MNIYLLRHGQAEPAAEGKTDAERALTPEGEKTIRDILPGLKKMVEQVEYSLTSPAARAVRTATILAEYYKCVDFLEIKNELGGSGGEASVGAYLNKLIGKDHVVVVGHEPYLSDLAKYLCGNPDGALNLKKGGMAKIYVAGFPGPGEGQLRWTMTPEELARV